LANRSGRFCLETPKRSPSPKLNKRTWNTGKLGAKETTKEDLAHQKPPRKPTRDQTSQAGQFFLGSREKLHLREELQLHLNRSLDSLHGFK
jgi:hypothetical protein